MTESYNACGECKVCCQRPAIPQHTWLPEGKKPRDTLCEKYCNGCTIYATRPKVCADFQCLWLWINNNIPNTLPIEMRPDQSKIMVTSQMNNGVGMILLDEVEEGALDFENLTPQQQRLIDEIVRFMQNQTVPTELHYRRYDWNTYKLNISYGS